MRAIEAFHHTFSEAGTHTFELGQKPNSILVKNFTNNFINFSFGNEIDTTNGAYSQLKKDTAERFPYQANEMNNYNVTVQALGTGYVEIRIVE